MKILITGATGLIGEKLIIFFIEKGVIVNYLTTDKKKIKTESNCKGFYWNPAQGYLDINSLNGVETIINLAGASISKRWTSKYKEQILESRINALNTLYKALKSNEHSIKHIITASAIGIYKSDYQSLYSETDMVYSNTFLSTVVQKWEDSVSRFKLLSLIVTKVRIGVVLDKNAGALPQIVKPISNSMGAVLGSGKQYLSWIHIKDIVGIFDFLVTQKKEGIFNAVAPNPVTNEEITKVIASTINKPLFLPAVPTFVLKIILGEMAAIVLESQKVSSKKIESIGYKFQFSEIEPAIKDLLK